MYKQRSSSMLRGAYHRPGLIERTKNSGFGKITATPTLRDEDRLHLGYWRGDQQDFLKALRERVLSLSKNGISKPADVSKALNAQGIRTATGYPWNPRLVYLLLAKLFATPKKKKAGKRPKV